MSERFTDDLTRELIEQIDARLRDAERLRNHADDRRLQRPFWPDRRRVGRVPGAHDPSRHPER
jgi:hypothetical protein